MGIADAGDAVDVQRVAPEGVLADVGLGRGGVCLVRVGQHLALLLELEVAVGILQGIDAVFAGCHAFDDETARAVGTRDALQRLGAECRVGQVVIQSDADALDGFEVRRVEHVARHLEGVDALAGRERVGIVAHRVVFVVVADGVAEVYRIGGIGLQRVLQFYDDALAGGLDFGHLQLRRRHDDTLRRVGKLDELVEVEGDFAVGHIRALLGGRAAHNARRVFVVPSAVGIAHAGTA